MKTRNMLIHFAAVGLLAAAMPASAQLLGGSVNGALQGTLQGTAGGGVLQGGVNGSGSLHGEPGGGIRDAAGRARDVGGEAVGKSRDAARGTVEKSRDVAGDVASTTRSSVAGARDTAGGITAAAEGSASTSIRRASESAEGAQPAPPASDDGGLSLGLGMNGGSAFEGGNRHADADASLMGEGSMERGEIGADGSASGNASFGKRDQAGQQPETTPAD